MNRFRLSMLCSAASAMLLAAPAWSLDVPARKPPERKALQQAHDRFRQFLADAPHPTHVQHRNSSATHLRFKGTVGNFEEHAYFLKAVRKGVLYIDTHGDPDYYWFLTPADVDDRGIISTPLDMIPRFFVRPK